jgi:hypothetical protein
VASLVTYPPSSSDPRSFGHDLELFGYILGSDPKHVFLVNIASTMCVAALKEAIKEKDITLRHVNAHALTLWKISIPFNHRFNGNIDVKDGEELILTEKLSRIFLDQPEEGHVHIAVRCPP